MVALADFLNVNTLQVRTGKNPATSLHSDTINVTIISRNKI